MTDSEADRQPTLWSSPRLSVPALVQRLGTALSSRYIIERELGRGGMAVVFLARDVKHGRKVAIKVLHQDLSDAVGSARFLREVRTTARLQHPHVLALYDSGEVDGLLYYIMPYVHGETLADRLRRDGALPVPLAIQLGLEIADALVYAHSLGVVHRDIKPANVLLSEGAHACVADFGLARLLSSATNLDLTATGIVLGSPLYMSPEQINDGSDVGGRADVYSFGCMLFEMVAGHPPFEGPTMQAVLTKHLMEDPPMLRTWRPEVDPELDRLIIRAMHKEPELRPDAYELRDRLSALRASGDATASLPRTPMTARAQAADAKHTSPAASRWALRRTALTSVLLLGAAVAAATLGPSLYREIVPPSDAEAVAVGTTSIAVLPFENLSGQPDSTYFSDGVTEDILTKLGKLGEFTVISSAATTSYRGSAKSPREIGRELGVSNVLTGSIRRNGGRVKITVQLVDASSGRLLWGESYDRELTDLFETQSEIAGRIITALQEELTPEQRRKLAHNSTQDISAYSYYLKGREYLMRFREPRDVELAMQLFDQALALDPRYAAAAAGKGLGYQMLYQYYDDTGVSTETLDSAISMGRQAIALDSTLPDGYAVLGRALRHHRPVAAAVQLEQAIGLNPNDVVTVSAMSRVNIELGRYDEGLKWAKRAVAISPTRAEKYSLVGEAYLFLEDFQAAERWLRVAIQLEPDELWANFLMAWLYTLRSDAASADRHIKVMVSAAPDGRWGHVQAGWLTVWRRDFDQALGHYTRALELSPVGRSPPLDLAPVYQAVGRAKAAEDILRAYEASARSLIAVSGESPRPYWTLARISSIRGDPEIAIKWLEQAEARGWRDVNALLFDPFLEHLRGDARFQRIVTDARAELARMRQNEKASPAG